MKLCDIVRKGEATQGTGRPNEARQEIAQEIKQEKVKKARRGKARQGMVKGQENEERMEERRQERVDRKERIGDNRDEREGSRNPPCSTLKSVL
jgi:hypothetical protein